MTTHKLSDLELVNLAADHMPAGLGVKYIQFLYTTDFDADDGDDTQPSIDPYQAKLFFLLAACGPRPHPTLRDLMHLDRFTLARIGRLCSPHH
jgi:hypothetical protein